MAYRISQSRSRTMAIHWRFLLIVAACASLVLCEDAAEGGVSAAGAVDEDEVPSASATVPADDEEDDEEQPADAEDSGDPSEPLEQEPLTSNQMHTLHGKMDGNQDGKLSLQEIIDFSGKMRDAIAKKETESMMGELDKNEDGKISFEEVLGDEDQYEGIETEEDKANLEKRNKVEKAKFQAADADKNGFLELSELPSILFPDTHAVIVEIQTGESMKDKDTDKNGVLTPKEFYYTSSSGDDTEHTEENQAEFKKLDTDQNGVIDLKELSHYESGKFHQEEAFKKLIDVADKDGDKMITADELVKARHPIAKTEVQYHLSEWQDHRNDEL